MGGKQKNAQRTKGNAKPSSSARAAELLTAGGATATGFVGFGSLSGDLGYVPVANGTEEADSSVDADFRFVLRKLSKRDATTKIKALQEFCRLCMEKTSEDMLTVLPFWPRIYNRMALDVDRRVREASQQAHHALVVGVGRELARELRTLVAVWMIAQCDPHAPVASAARAAFNIAFPPEKQSQALVFCKHNIINHIKDMLLTQTASTLSDPKSTEPEDMEGKFERVLACSLLAWRRFMAAVPASEQLDLQETYSSILQQSKFWKLAKHSSSIIRAAFYSILAGLCHSNSGVAQQFAGKICPLVLHNLHASDPMVCPALWEAVLYVVSSLEDPWMCGVNLEKGVLPGLWRLLRDGGSGSAVHIYPSLLPLLSKLPPELPNGLHSFYSNFFTNIKIGLCEEKVQVSSMELNAVVQATIECLQYVITINAHDPTLCDTLLEDQLLPLLDASFMDKATSVSRSCLYGSMACLLSRLHQLRQPAMPSDADNVAPITRLHTHIWKLLHKTCLQHMAADDTPHHAVQRIATFLITLKNPSTITQKKTKGVRFLTENVENDVKNIDEQRNIKEAEKKVSSTSLEGCIELSALISDTCNAALSKALHFSAPYVAFLSSLADVYMDANLINDIYKERMSTEIDAGIDVAGALFTDVLLPWLHSYSNDCGQAVLRDLVTFCILVLQRSRPDTEVTLLNQIFQLDTSADMLHELSGQLLQSCVATSPRLLSWFRDASFGKFIVSLTEHLLVAVKDRGARESGESRWVLMRLALNQDTGRILGKEYVNRVLVLLHESVPVSLPECAAIFDPLVDLICDTADLCFPNIEVWWDTAAGSSLLLALFKLACSQHWTSLNAETQKKLQSTWQLGVKHHLQVRGLSLDTGSFMCEAFEHLKSCVSAEATSLERLSDLCELGSRVLAVGRCYLTGVAGSGQTLEEEEGDSPRPAHITYPQLLGALCMPFTHEHTGKWWERIVIKNTMAFESVPRASEDISEGCVTRCVAPSAFTSFLLISACTPHNNVNSTEDTETAHMDTVSPKSDCDGDEVCVVDTAVDWPGVVEAMQDVVYSLAYCQTCVQNRKEDYQHSELSKLAARLDSSIDTLIQSMPCEECSHLLQTLLQRSFNEGNLWAIVLHIFLQKSKSKLSSLPFNLGTIMDRLNTLDEASVHTIGVLLRHVPLAETSLVAEIALGQIATLPQQAITTMSGGLGLLCVLKQVLSMETDPLVADIGTNANMPPILAVTLLDELHKWHASQDDLLVFDVDVCGLSMEVVSLNIEIMESMGAAVVRIPTQLSPTHWDFILCSLISWLQSCMESQSSLCRDLQCQRLAVSCLGLAHTVCACMHRYSLLDTKDDTTQSTLPLALLSEWNEFFSQAVFNAVVPLYIHMTDSVELNDPRIGEDLVLESVSRGMAYCSANQLSAVELEPRLLAGHESSLPDSVQTLLNHLCPLLMAPHRPAQLAAYAVLNRLMAELPAYDVDHDRGDELKKEEVSCAPPYAVLAALESSEPIVEVALEGLRFGDALPLEPGTEEYTYTTAFLLSWRLIIAFFKAAPSELKAEYASYVRTSGLLDSLLDKLFHLMPESPLVRLKEGLKSQPPSQKLMPASNMFSELPSMDPAGASGSIELQHLACAVYKACLQELPAAVRQWWNTCDKHTAAIVDRFTTKYVSPILCSEELGALQAKNVDSENMTVRVRPVSREVIATYTVQEFSMELVVTLPPSHPLAPVHVDSSKHIGVTQTQWRNWLLQLTTFLTHQNGCIIDGLILWKKNVDKRFEGLDDCLICFSVIHNSNYQLPKQTCRVCKKKFHSACLYKWFNTSSNSSCPVCRSLF